MRRIGLACVLAVAGLCLGAPSVHAQTGPGGSARGGVQEEDPRPATLRKMMRRVTVTFEGETLEQVLVYLERIAGVEFDPLWTDERRDGLDREAEIELDVERMPVLNVLERVLDKVSEDFDAATWQLNRDGQVQVGPRSRLNRFAYLRIYYIHDLVFVIPDFDNAPDLDLNNILGGGGGGGGDSPFEDDDDDDEGGLSGAALNEDAIEELLDVIRLAIEPDQWEDNGGDGGVIREFQGNLIVRAPAYMHRQLGGFDFVPRRYRPFVNEERLERRRAIARGEDPDAPVAVEDADAESAEAPAPAPDAAADEG